MGSTGSTSRGSPLLGGMGSAKPTLQGSPQKLTQPAGSNSKLLFMKTFDCFQLNVKTEAVLASLPKNKA